MTSDDVPIECPNGPHRGPQGPNEDLSQCPVCWSPSHAMRPEGQTYGKHLPDCRLPIRHPSWCESGGSGHPAAGVIRGYWPTEGTTSPDVTPEPFDPTVGCHPDPEYGGADGCPYVDPCRLRCHIRWLDAQTQPNDCLADQERRSQGDY